MASVQIRAVRRGTAIRAAKASRSSAASPKASNTPTSAAAIRYLVAMNEVASCMIRSGVSPGCAGGSGRSSVIHGPPL
jgi:hypothetical protein